MPTDPATKSTAEGVLLKVRAAPGASRDKIAGLHGDALKVTVSAPPEKGKANDAIVVVLAKALGVAKTTVTLASGPTSRDKWFRFEGLTEAGLLERLGEILEI